MTKKCCTRVHGRYLTQHVQGLCSSHPGHLTDVAVRGVARCQGGTEGLGVHDSSLLPAVCICVLQSFLQGPGNQSLHSPAVSCVSLQHSCPQQDQVTPAHVML